MAQKHEDMCKICLTLTSEDIESLEREALDRKDNYTNIGAKYGIKYEMKITKQQVSNHMQWFKKRKLEPERDKLLEERKEEILDALAEHGRLHSWLWFRIIDLENMKKDAPPERILRINNTQDRYIKSILKGLRLLAELRGDADRDTRKIDITVAVKEFAQHMKDKEEE